MKSHKSEKYCMSDGQVKVTGKPSKYFSLTERFCEVLILKVADIDNSAGNSALRVNGLEVLLQT